MIFITQLIYIREGQEDVFHQFEDIAIPAIAKYNGRLLLRVRPDDQSMIEGSIGKPYEIHLVEFDSEQDFENFAQDEERKKFLHLKEQSVQSVLLIKGTKPQTPDMEVHHHPQLEHKPKPWKEYLLEGLMIFIAVMLGFFAENLRERISDSHRESEFAKELYAELKDDSAMAAHLLAIRIDKRKDIDYLYGYFKDSSLTDLPKPFYPAFSTSLYLFNTYSFEPKDGILSQLRNSGSLRYFKSVELQKLLGDISVCINNVRSRNEQEYQYFASPLKPFLLKYYDFSWLDKLRNGDNQSYLLDLINGYRVKSNLIVGKILNVFTLDRSEVCNMVFFYKQMLISTESLQLNNYIITNRKILQVLRENYSVGSE